MLNLPPQDRERTHIPEDRNYKLRKRIWEILEDMSIWGATEADKPEWVWIALEKTTDDEIVAFGKRLRKLLYLWTLYGRKEHMKRELHRLREVQDDAVLEAAITYFQWREGS